MPEVQFRLPYSVDAIRYRQRSPASRCFFFAPDRPKSFFFFILRPSPAIEFFGFLRTFILLLRGYLWIRGIPLPALPLTPTQRPQSDPAISSGSRPRLSDLVKPSSVF